MDLAARQRPGAPAIEIADRGKKMMGQKDGRAKKWQGKKIDWLFRPRLVCGLGIARC